MSTFLIVHIVIAITSIIVSSFVFFKPSMKRFAVSYGLILATVGTGTGLLIMNPSNILHTCLSGLFYITVVSLITIATHVRVRKSAHQEL